MGRGSVHRQQGAAGKYELCSDAARTVALTLLRRAGTSRDYTAAGAVLTPEASVSARTSSNTRRPARRRLGRRRGRGGRRTSTACRSWPSRPRVSQGELGDSAQLFETGSAEAIVSAIRTGWDTARGEGLPTAAKGIADARLRVSGAESHSDEEAIGDVVLLGLHRPRAGRSEEDCDASGSHSSLLRPPIP